METRESAQRLDHETSEQEFAEFVDRARRELDSQRLVELLPERTPVYQRRSANTVNRCAGTCWQHSRLPGCPKKLCPMFSRSLRAEGTHTWLRRRRGPFGAANPAAPTPYRSC